MNQNTRQRIIGTVVLAIVAIVLLPAIFDGESSYQSSLQTDMPDRPERPQASREFQQRPVIQADSDAIQVRDPLPGALPDELSDDDGAAGTDTATQSAATTAADTSELTASDDTDESIAQAPSPESADEDEAPAPASDVASTTNNDEPGLDASGLPEAWSVRVGAFGNASNAANLLQRLSDGGHRAYTRPVSSSGRELTAVFVGPLISRQEAQGVLGQVKTDFDLNGMIVRYEIEGP